jgi:hypothetical protein
VPGERTKYHYSYLPSDQITKKHIEATTRKFLASLPPGSRIIGGTSNTFAQKSNAKGEQVTAPKSTGKLILRIPGRKDFVVSDENETSVYGVSRRPIELHYGILRHMIIFYNMCQFEEDRLWEIAQAQMKAARKAALPPPAAPMPEEEPVAKTEEEEQAELEALLNAQSRSIKGISAKAKKAAKEKELAEKQKQSAARASLDDDDSESSERKVVVGDSD